MDIEVSPTNEKFPNMFGSITKIFSHANPVVLTIITVVMILFFVMFHYLGVSPYNVINLTERKNTGMFVIETIMWGLFIFLILINGLQYIFKLDVKTALHDVMTKDPKIEISVSGEDKALLSNEKQIRAQKQVFHIPDNSYNYDNAKALCKAYGARLANQHEVDKAYRDGAEWCSYGWSQDQLALFPTQESTWFKLKKIKGHENDCGRPGINGGFIGNPETEFGVNCFGYKPEANIISSRHMRDSSPFPRSKSDKRMEKKIERYKKKMEGIPVSAFSNGRWSKI